MYSVRVRSPGPLRPSPEKKETEWRRPKGQRFPELTDIRQPTLVVNGSNDVMIPTVNSIILAQHIPHAQLIICPDAGHAAHFQYAAFFLQHATLFLDA